MSDIFKFHCPVKIVSGMAALEKLPNELKQLGAKRPLLVSDPGVSAAGLLDQIYAAFDESEIKIAEAYDQVPADSPIGNILEIVDLYNELRCDSFIAIGGGSAIDTTKAANIKVTEPGIDLLHFKSVWQMRKPPQPLIVIPTTAGTGSEVSSAAVIFDTEKGIKLPLVNPNMTPSTAVIDPRMTVTLPPALTASTGMDALAHAVEACIGTLKNPISDACAASAIQLIGQNLVEAVRNGQNLEARMAMANAATLAGMAFSNSMTSMVHALGHSAGAVCHIPHGTAMSLFLPGSLEFNQDTIGDFLAELLPHLAGTEATVKIPFEQRASRFIEIIREMQVEMNALCGLPLTLKEAGVTEDKLEEIADLSVKDGTAVYNRKKFNEADALGVIKKVFE